MNAQWDASASKVYGELMFLQNLTYVTKHKSIIWYTYVTEIFANIRTYIKLM